MTLRLQRLSGLDGSGAVDYHGIMACVEALEVAANCAGPELNSLPSGGYFSAVV